VLTNNEVRRRSRRTDIEGDPVSFSNVQSLNLMERSSPSITADEFKSAFRGHPGGVAVITADAGDGPVGLTATSVISASVEPNILAFSVSEFSSSTPTIRRADTVVVHLLSAEQVHIAKLCATSGIDRFADTSLWSRLETGEPYFPSAKTWIRGRIVNSLAAGGSAILAVEALEASPGLSGDALPGTPLVYHNRSWHALGDASQI
jgi:flavin reductase (DIM6/NTAB) family NADH-FMN oxidoreductase RutF